MLLIEYPKCSTCVKARKYLDSKKIAYEVRDIVNDKLSANELDEFIKMSKKDVNKFFNTSGLKYRALHLKDKLPILSYEEKLELLSTDGMLVKRPLLVLEDNVLIGFKEKEWEQIKD